ncbi:cytochrome c oxidase subunit 3 [Patulibacter minatonensis]|uniref:cytochrome c oxidase subunit 3 n=1 Tax=Patulibacter minatonensis TaxID=298163 RepID=UPI0004AFD0AC|nr:cytochrome c oxidase subunit 3 [Patulibacter minatonensis]
MSTTIDERPAATAPPVVPDARTHVPGEIGIWVFILLDLATFAALFAAFLHDRGGDAELYAASQAKLSQDFGALNTLILLTSSLLVVAGVRGIRAGRLREARLALYGAVACALAFCVVKVFEWGGKFADDITPTTNGFWEYYFGLTGIHLFHLLIGLGVLTFMLRRTRKAQLTGADVANVETGASFWHMVDLIWIVIFPLLYLAH